MSLYQVNKIIEKLSSCSLDVQQSAIRNLISKISCGLVDLNDLCDKNPTIGVTLFQWASQQQISISLEILNQVIDLLKEISKHHAIKQNLKKELQSIIEFRQKMQSLNIDNKNLEQIIKNVADGQEIVHPSESQFKKDSFSQHQESKIEILQKPNAKTVEYVSFPFVKLTESDEKFLFDISVQLKFGNPQTILFTIKEQLWRALKDFPIECFRSRSEIIEEVLILSNSQKDDNIIYYSLIVLHKFIVKLTKRFRKNKAEENFNQNSEVYKQDTREHIVYSYPSLDPQKENQQNLEIISKSLKGQVDLIIRQIFNSFNKFIGRRINIIFKIIELIKKVQQINSDAALDQIILTINELTQIFDTNEESLHQQHLIPLYFIGYELLQLLPSDFKLQNIQRFCSYLMEASYNNIFSLEQVLNLFDKCGSLNSNLFQGKIHQDLAVQTLELLFQKQQYTQHIEVQFIQKIVNQLIEQRYIMPLQFAVNQRQFQVPILDVTIEELSNLETKVTSKDSNFADKISSLDQLILAICYFMKNKKDFLNKVQVKESLFKQYLNDLLINLQKKCIELFEKYQNERQKSQRADLENVFCKFLDLFTLSAEFMKLGVFEFILLLIQSTQNTILTQTAFRCLISITLVREIQSKDNFYIISKQAFDYKSKSDQFWENVPLQKKINEYLSQFLLLIQDGVLFQKYKQKLIYIKKTPNFIESLDLVQALKINKIQFKFDESIYDDLRQLLSSTLFLSSGKMYVLNIISKFEDLKQMWLPLLTFVHQCFLENVGEEQIEYLNLYIQLLSVIKQSSEIGKSAVKYLSKYPFNMKVANYILKLLKYGSIEHLQDLLKYLQQNILQHYYHLNFENSNCLIKLLEFSRKCDLFDKLEPLDQSILFSKLIQLTKSHISKIRYLALNIISINIQKLSPEQLNRLEDQVIDDLYQSNESQYVFSQIIAIVLKLRPAKKLTRIISYTDNRLKSGISSLCKAGLLRILLMCIQENKEETIFQIYNLQIDQLCVQYLTQMKDLDQLFLAFHSAQIINHLMRQSVSKSLALLQSYNLIEVVLHSIHKCRKHLNCSQPNLISGLLLQASLLFQFSAHYHKDYFEFQYIKVRKNKPKWNLISIVGQSLQNDNFNLESKIGIAKTIQCVYQIEQSQFINEDLIYSLSAIFRQLLPITDEGDNDEQERKETNYIASLQILSAVVSASNNAKFITCKNGISKQITQFVLQELENVINKNQKNSQKTLNKSQNVMNTSNVSFVQTNLFQSQLFKAHLTYLKLLFKTVPVKEDNELPESVQINEVVGLNLQIIIKLLYLGFTLNSQNIFELMSEIMMNLGGNQSLSNSLSQQLNESKQLLIVELKKYFLKDTLSLYQSESILKCLSILGQNQDLRQVFIRMKIIEEVQEKLNRYWMDKRKWQTNTQGNKQIISFILSVSFYKETQERILANNQFINIIQEIIDENNNSELICQDILLIYSNCSLNSKLKKTILNNQQFSCQIMNIISEVNNKADIRFKATQFLLNLMFKCTQAVSIFNKQQIFDCFEFSIKDGQRQIDRLQISLQQDKNTLISKQEQTQIEIKHLQNFLNNLSQIIKILRIEW